VSTAVTVARASQHFSQGEGAERDSFGIEPSSAQQLQMFADNGAAHGRRYNQRVGRLPPDPGESDHGIVDREWQMFFECKRDYLLEAPTVGEWQRKQSFGDILTG